MTKEPIRFVLADDDMDDCLLFKDALQEIDIPVPFIAVHDGQELMQFLLEGNYDFLNIIFLDLNMPIKNGFECLREIKSSDKLKETPVIIFSTSFDPGIAGQLYDIGANYYIRKPNEYLKLKKVITYVLGLARSENILRPPKQEFVIQL